ncbi:hypothetical protein THRCLA_02151 [Thraustotheca clavata]|uniref:Uncharacterized protein n=1 Tax=Thraustotheca clavata TaxID=74557 RepID=A0A1W0A638_9STRA|nr:hypothetical protein THRCLA_02151 [Thraustotheca clavata]
MLQSHDEGIENELLDEIPVAEPRVLSIEDFDEDASSNCEILNSPRTLEACCEVGVTPDELIKRPIEYFIRPQESSSLTQKRCDRYELQRVQLIEQVRATRQSIIQKQNSPMKSSCRYDGNTLKMFSKANKSMMESTMIETERKRLERIQQRQLLEMQQLMQIEIRQAEMEAQRIQEAAIKKKREEELEKEKVKRAREVDEIRRQRELEKVQDEQETIMAQKKLTQRNYQEAQRHKALEAAEEKARRLESIERERERQRKQDEHREKTQAILTELQEQALERVKEMNEREKSRVEKLERAREERARRMQQKAQKNKERVENVLSDKERLAIDQRQSLEYRQAESERRREQREHELSLRKQQQTELEEARRAMEAEIRQNQLIAEEERRQKLIQVENEAEYRLRLREEAKVRERILKMQEDAKRQEERERVAERMRKVEEERQSNVLAKCVEKSTRNQTAQDRRRIELRMKLEDAKLREEEIAKALERQARKDDYHRSQLSSKIEADKQRSEAIRAQKDALLKKRKLVKQKAEIQRHEILDSFTKMKITKKFDVEHFASKNGIDISVCKSVNSSVEKPVTARPKSASRPTSKPTKRPMTAKARSQTTASSICRERYISRRISRYPREEKPKQESITSSSSELEIESSNEDAIREQLEQFRRHQNQELLHILEEEQAAEEQREIILRNASDAAERRRLEKIFGVERNQASERIMHITEEHEIMFAQRMADLNYHLPTLKP